MPALTTDDDLPTRLGEALRGTYRIERELGGGGMARVFLANEIALDRRVVIKLLPGDMGSHLSLARFEREIAMAARLQHAHIVPLLSAGQADGIPYYTMPFVDGESLRARLDRGERVPLHAAVRELREIASALAYAHAHGIVHRDIKPDNVLLSSGAAMVTDFGVAKAVSDAAGVSSGLTSIGMAIGTPAYMAPEQVSADPLVDHRADLYAWGVLAYELLTGQSPFAGRPLQSMLAAHLTEVPVSVAERRNDVSLELAQLVMSSLEKDPANRPQSANDILTVLDTVSSSGSRSAPTWTYPIALVRSRKGVWIGGAVIAALVIAGSFLFRSAGRPSPPIQLGRRTPVSLEPGLELDPSLSPDGKLVAYSAANGMLTVKQVEGGSPVQVVRGPDAKGRWPSWLPDGQRLVFVSPRGIEVVSALGGAPRLLVSGTQVARGVTVSPDGKAFAYISRDSLFTQPVDGGSARLIAHTNEGHSPAWSPDGQWIAFVQGNRQYINVIDLGNMAFSSIWLAPAEGGTPHRVTDDRSLHASPAWVSPRSLLYVSDQDGGRDVYELSLTTAGMARGAPVRSTTGLGPYAIAVARNGSRIAYAPFTETSNIWSVPVPATGAVALSTAVQETEGNQLIENLDASNDGQWLGYSGNRAGTSQVYVARRGVKGEGAATQQVTSDSAPSYWAAWSPDGKEVAFHRSHGGRRQIYVSPIEGGSATPVTDGSEDDRSPEWSPDGHQLLFLANWGTTPAVRVTTRASDGRWSKPRTIPIVIGRDTITPGLAVWSPDGRFIACGCGEGGIVIAPVDGGPARRLASSFSTAGWAFPQWSPDGKTVLYLSEDAGRVVAVIGAPVDGGPARAVVRFDDPARAWHRYGFRVRAGRMFLTLGSRESDVWVADIARDSTTRQ